MKKKGEKIFKLYITDYQLLCTAFADPSQTVAIPDLVVGCESD